MMLTWPHNGYHHTKVLSFSHRGSRSLAADAILALILWCIARVLQGLGCVHCSYHNAEFTQLDRLHRQRWVIVKVGSIVERAKLGVAMTSLSQITT